MTPDTKVRRMRSDSTDGDRTQVAKDRSTNRRSYERVTATVRDAESLQSIRAELRSSGIL